MRTFTHSANLGSPLLTPSLKSYLPLCAILHTDASFRFYVVFSEVGGWVGFPGPASARRGGVRMLLTSVHGCLRSVSYFRSLPSSHLPMSVRNLFRLLVRLGATIIPKQGYWPYFIFDLFKFLLRACATHPMKYRPYHNRYTDIL